MLEMNIFQLIQANPSLTVQIQKSLLETLKTHSKCSLDSKPANLKENKTKFKISILSMLSLSNKSGEKGVLALGFSDNSFMKIYENTLNPKPEGIGPENVNLAGALINVIYKVIAPELSKKGTTFDPAVPIVLLEKEVSDSAKVAVDRSLVFPFSSEQGDLYFEIPEIMEAPAERPHDSTVKPQKLLAFETRILLVDDSGTTRKISKKALSELGYTNIIEASDGALAWELIVQGNPPVDIVISDWHMPNMTGLELLTKIRRTPETKTLPVIMVTAERNKEEVMKIISLGAQGYLAKPFDQSALQKLVDKIVNK